MKTIALRFTDNFAPKIGTIKSHEELIALNGYVWYGKLGAKVSIKMIDTILDNNPSRILLIHSGTPDRFWATVEQISYKAPELNEFPSYYADKTENIKTWFKIVHFERAPKDIMSMCTVSSSGERLSYASKHSMSPYFIIDCEAIDI